VSGSIRTSRCTSNSVCAGPASPSSSTSGAPATGADHGGGNDHTASILPSHRC
jgi:hypothetical protein